MTVTTSIQIQRSADRAAFDHGWLQTSHSFSFADYQDPQNMQWGALRVFNDDIVAPDQGFGTHPHRDMEILTYVLDGALTHRDSMGNERSVQAGGVQYLSAGTGITHSEYNASKTQALHFVQMWVMPRARGLAPRYGQEDFTAADRANRWLVVASGRENVPAPIALWQDAQCSVAALHDTTLPYTLESGRYGFVFVADGNVTLKPGTAGQSFELAAGDALRLQGKLDLQFSGTAELVAWDVPSTP